MFELNPWFGSVTFAGFCSAIIRCKLTMMQSDPLSKVNAEMDPNPSKQNKNQPCKLTRRGYARPSGAAEHIRCKTSCCRSRTKKKAGNGFSLSINVSQIEQWARLFNCKSSVPDQWHFGVDPGVDPDLYLRLWLMDPDSNPAISSLTFKMHTKN